MYLGGHWEVILYTHVSWWSLGGNIVYTCILVVIGEVLLYTHVSWWSLGGIIVYTMSSINTVHDPFAKQMSVVTLHIGNDTSI